MSKKEMSRREFLKWSGIAAGGLILPRWFWPTAVEASTGNEVRGGLETAPVLPELLQCEERSGVLTAKDMPVVMFPVTRDNFYDFWKDTRNRVPATVEEFTISGLEIAYQNIYYAYDNDGETVVRFTVLPHTTGQRGTLVGILDEGRFEDDDYMRTKKMNYMPRKRYYTAESEGGVEHSIWGEFYPNKVNNILEAVAAIDDYQQANGGFKKGQTYSMVELLNLHGRRGGYKLGLNGAKKQVTGGGVCVVATNMCKFQRLMGSEVKERWMHFYASRYSSSPSAGWLLREDNSDATVEDGNGKVFDFRWVAPKSGYIRLSADVIPNGKFVKGDFGDGDAGGDTADASILVSFKWENKNPGVQAIEIKRVQADYLAMREGEVMKSKGRLMRSYPWKRGDTNYDFVASILPEERISRFAKEIEGGDANLSCLYQLREIVNSYDPKSGLLAGDWVRQYQWYLDQLNRLSGDSSATKRFESALNHLNWNTKRVEGQPVQCFGLAVLLNGLSLPGLNFRSIGGASAEDGTPAAGAADLVPNKIKEGGYKSASRGSYTARVVTSLDEVQPGDLFVKYDTKVGHIGGVVGRKVVNGETILLFASANQTGDGQMKIFEVDGNNFDVVMGPPPYAKVVIR